MGANISSSDNTKAHDFSSKVSHLGTFVNQEYGVAITPAGLVFSATQVAHVPVVIHLTLPEWKYKDEQDMLHSGCMSHVEGEPCDIMCCLNFTCRPSSHISTSIEILKQDLKEAYGSVLDTSYYATLLNSICTKNPRFCVGQPLREKRFLPILSAMFGLTGTGLGIANSIN